jgi:hypothetical protein
VEPSVRPPHLIHPDEVAGWLAGSRVQTVTYHRTDPLSARAILERGVDISRAWIGSYGQGFYTSTVPDPTYGEHELVVAVRLLDPLWGDEWQVGEVLESTLAVLRSPGGHITPMVGAGIRQELLQLGYDGIVVEDGGGDGEDYVIALNAEAVRIVVE